MKDQIITLLETALVAVLAQHDQTDIQTDIQLENTRDPAHGDLACNIAMRLAKPLKQNPRAIAQAIVDNIPANALIAKTDIAGPGFINFYLKQDALSSVVKQVVEAAEQFGRNQDGAGKRVQVEYVSANPTGPLHVGHGRGAAYGSVLANILRLNGYDVHAEYYVNDAGRQMDILATSVWLRYLELCGEKFAFPSNGYKGDYIFDIAATVHREHGSQFHKTTDAVFADVTADEPAGGDKEAHIDDLIDNAKSLLGKADYRKVFGVGLNTILTNIRDDLAEFGVHFEEWFSELSLHDSGFVAKAIDRLKEAGHVYEQGGAWWFRSTDFGDEKDRVVIRDNGQHTYFASDIAYHLNKLDRGFDQLIDIWGADHHGYVPRVKACLQASGADADKLDVLLVQFAILYRGGEKAQMSTRSGEFVTLRELREEVGNDAARYFYVMRKCEQHLDFDLDLAKSKSNENPVYYIQYAHARICSVFRELGEKKIAFDLQQALNDLDVLESDHEQALLKLIQKYPEIVRNAGKNKEPHLIPNYLRELANGFHTYYNASKFLVDDEKQRNGRLALVHATRQVIQNGLSAIGVSAPEAM